MNIMKSIIVPVNFSACAANAARYAADLAAILHADLHLIHVIQVPVTSAEMNMTQYLYEELVDSANQSLKQLQVDLRKHTQGKINIETILDSGSLTTKIKDRCNEIKPYAIVLGATGPSLEKFLAGSPIASLLHNLDYPVLVVPENVPFRHYHHILLACDLSDIGHGLPQSMPLLKDLRDHFGCRFDVLTVETPKILAREHAVFSTNDWQEPFRHIYPDIHFIKTPKVEEGILEYLNHHEADLVMVFPKKHGLFEFHVSQSRKLAKHSPIPVLSLHE
jgi:nucleotide-binding universal stress UspA family protein